MMVAEVVHIINFLCFNIEMSQKFLSCLRSLLNPSLSDSNVIGLVYTNTKMKVTDVMPLMARNVPLQPTFSCSTCTRGLIINNPPPGPMAISPRLIERHFIKYLGTAIYVIMTTPHDPKPKKPPYVTNMM